MSCCRYLMARSSHTAVGAGGCSCEALERSLKLSLTYVFSHVGLCTCVAGYSVAGAFIFKWLEEELVEGIVEADWGPYSRTNASLACLERLRSILMTAVEGSPEGDSYSDWTRANEHLDLHWKNRSDTLLQELERFQKEVAEAVRDGIYYRQTWNLMDSLFFCVTVITTIGYGHHVPQTMKGKLATILYAVFGIPLFLLTISNIGNSMASAFRFAYTRLCCCCVKKKPDQNELSPRRSQTGEPPPYIPPPKYAPKRKKMVISPPISATLHRGNDLPARLPHQESKKELKQLKNSTSSSPSPIYTRDNPLALAPTALEARKLVAECAAYASSHIPGFTPDPSDMAYDERHLEQSRATQRSQHSHHDYDLISGTMMVEPPTPSPSTTSPTQSTPSSPLSREGPVVAWNVPRGGAESLSPVVTIAGANLGALNMLSLEAGGSSSSQSTRAASPSFNCPSTSSYRGENTVTWAVEDPTNFGAEGKTFKRHAGKTLVVYNTMSGDALQQQSKIARRMALMHKKKHRTGRYEESAIFMDPITGQTVDGNIMGLNYRPIPPEPSRNDVRVPIPIVSTFVALYIMAGAFLFQQLEGWELADSAYFCFITLSTIGFGDLVPGKALGYETWLAQFKLATAALYLLIGLAVLAMSFNLVQEEVVLKCKAVAQYVGLMKE